ncbi:MAG: hypothetical protein AABX98_01265, partial [Nanoarchaeota archaeon]
MTMNRGRFLLLVVVFSILSSVLAGAYPQVGHQFYGYVGAGSTVKAVAGDVTYSVSANTSGYYGYSPLFFVETQTDDIDGAKDGETITFYVNSAANTTYTFKIGGITKLDFEDDPATTAIDNIATTSSTTNTATSITTTTDDNRGSSKKKSSTTTTTTTSKDSGCYHTWKCTSWSACQSNSFQTRTCYYVGNCTTEGNQSDTRQRCAYVAPEEEAYVAPEASCYDDIKNQGERGVDCGGPCDACPTAPIVEEPKTNWLYIGLAIFLILLI